MASTTSGADIPTISINAECLPQAWEKAVLAVWGKGVEIKTEYDKPDDPPSKDATVIITVSTPFAEPRIHKNFPGGPAELEAYRQEVLNGIHDHWIEPKSGKWTYTYHQRLFAYCGCEGEKIDQIKSIVDTLARTSHSRRAQAITWIPAADVHSQHPPCLQRIWCRLVGEGPGRWLLSMNAHWRSRDLYKAWFMNAYALTDLQRVIAERISQQMGQSVGIGRYVDITDSLHIYGSYFYDVTKEVEKMRKSSFTERAWQSTHSAFAAMTNEARQRLAQDPDWYAKAKG